MFLFSLFIGLLSYFLAADYFLESVTYSRTLGAGIDEASMSEIFAYGSAGIIGVFVFGLVVASVKIAAKKMK